MEKATVRIKFADFAPKSFRAENSWIMNTLKKKYNVILSDDPEFLFYSTWGLEYKNYSNCVKVFCGGEAVSPNFNECDYAFGFEPIEYKDRYMQYPIGDTDSLGVYDSFKSLQKREKPSSTMFQRKFCNFVYSQDWWGEGAVMRREFCKKLMQYRRVDCPGVVLNNMPEGAIEGRWTGNQHGSGEINRNWSKAKIDFQKSYKFTIAFENTSLAGLTTEKLIDPFQAYSIPIYWGNPYVTELFNPKAFINANEYEGNFDALIERIKELDEDEDAYMEMLSQPPLSETFDFERVKKAEQFLFNIIERGNKPFAKDALHLSSSSRMYEEIQQKRMQMQIIHELGITDLNSNALKLVHKLQAFGNSKWGYIPKRGFHLLVKIYRKLKH